MSIELHTDCHTRLTELITNTLPQIMINNNLFLQRETTSPLRDADSIIPATGKIRESLEEYISESPVYDFLYGKISMELDESQQYSTETPTCPLTVIEGYTQPSATAERLISELMTLPWEYTFTIKLGNDFSKLFVDFIKEFKVCDEIRLTTSTDEFISNYPMDSDNCKPYPSIFNFLEATTYNLPKNACCLQLNYKGFVGKYIYSSPKDNAILGLKSFCGIGIALGLFKVNHSYNTSSERQQFLIHKKVDSGWTFQDSHELDRGLSDTLNDIDLGDYAESKTQKEVLDFVHLELNVIKVIFSEKEKNARLLLAGQWLFDSYCGRNELLSFIQTTVVLEIMLGDKSESDALGLGKLLKNRCAYLIGETFEERENLLKDFENIYDVRSKIVHRGKNKLDSSETTLFRKLQWICRRVIWAEVEKIINAKHKK